MFCRRCVNLQAKEQLTALVSLEKLSLADCALSDELSTGMSRLAALKTLDLSGCPFSEVPPSVSTLSALTVLNLSRCELLAELFDGISCLTALRSLSLSSCKALEALPVAISCLTALDSLKLRWCTSLAHIPPEALSRLGALSSIDYRGCPLMKTARLQLPTRCTVKR